MQLAPAEYMKVQVRNGFAGEEPVVYNNPKPVFKPAFFRDFRHGEHEVREYLGVFLWTGACGLMSLMAAQTSSL